MKIKALAGFETTRFIPEEDEHGVFTMRPDKLVMKEGDIKEVDDKLAKRLIGYGHAGGLLSVSLASADTTNLSGMLWQQLVMTDANNVVATLSTGTITFEQRTGSQTTPPPTQTPPTTVVFEYQSWAFLFPELATSVLPGQAAGYFARAELIVGNSSVSVSTEMNAPGSAGWWATSRYGYEAYSAMAPYRTFHYAAHPTRVVQPYPPYGFMSWR
jgi:hypothetical protein